MKVQDIVRSAVDEAKFMLSIRKLQGARQLPLANNPVEAVEVLADRFQLSQNERGDVLRQLFLGKDCSRYGFINAVTTARQLSGSYERATELEWIGGELLAMARLQPLLPEQPKESQLQNVTPKSPMRNVTPEIPRLAIVR